MSKRINALIAKTRQEQSSEIRALNELQSKLGELRTQQDALTMREALFVGTGGFGYPTGCQSPSRLAMESRCSESRRVQLSQISKEISSVEKAREQVSRKLGIVQERVKTRTRLLEHLSKMKS